MPAVELEDEIHRRYVSGVSHPVRFSGCVEDDTVGPDLLAEGLHRSLQYDDGHIMCIHMGGVSGVGL